jgi:hypothetical protein
VVEGGEVVVLVLDLGALEDLEAQPDEDVLELAADLGDQVQVTGRERRVAGQRDVDSILGEAPVELGLLERGAALGDQLLQPHAHRVGGLSHGAALLGRQLADRAQRRRQLGLPPEVADAQVLELRTRVGAPHRGLRLDIQLLEAALGGGLSHERPS